MNREIQKKENNTSNLIQRLDFNNKETVEYIRTKYCPRCTDIEFKEFCYVAQSMNLNPLLNEIHAVKYVSKDGGGKMNLIISIHAYTRMAHETGLLNGVEEDVIYVQKFVESLGKFVSTGEIDYGIATVWNKNCEKPFVAKVKFKEYKQENNMWRTKPETMIKKVALSHALRKAFNLVGYTADEMGSISDDIHVNNMNAIHIDETETNVIKMNETETKPNISTNNAKRKQDIYKKAALAGVGTARIKDYLKDKFPDVINHNYTDEQLDIIESNLEEYIENMTLQSANTETDEVETI